MSSDRGRQQEMLFDDFIPFSFRFFSALVSFAVDILQEQLFPKFRAHHGILAAVTCSVFLGRDDAPHRLPVLARREDRHYRGLFLVVSFFFSEAF